MSLVNRVQNIIIRPKLEWPVIAMEPATPASLYTSYIIPLAAIGPIFSFLSYALFLHHPIVGAAIAALSFVLELAYVFVAALIAQALASSFDGANDRIEALKWIAYSYTPRWVAGIALVIPIFGALLLLVASIYSLYVLYLGVGPTMRVPPEKSVGYVVVVILCLILVGFVVGAIVAAVGAAVMLSAAATAGSLMR
ncbi:MAG: YIP1 family protein [Candidatus Eremiobacteraeota bacterium]|nr:YIP1 family protein [Candidatus Eremiobacteraeota bacterium]